MKYIVAVLIAIAFLGCKNNAITTSDENKEQRTKAIQAYIDTLIYPEEKHFKAIRQVTFGGDNAEAYWSFDDKQLIFQSNKKAWDIGYDQIFLRNANETFTDSIAPPMLSTGKGHTTSA